MKNLVELYCIIDDLVKLIEKNIEKKDRGRKNKLTKSELITIALIGHFDEFETDKKLHEYVINYFNNDFKNVPCYEQFTRGIRSITKYLDFMINTLSQINITKNDNFYIVDSSALPVSEYDDFECPKWAADDAKKGKNIFGYYFGFKVHLIINRSMDIVSCMFTTANVHDINALKADSFVENIKGTLVGDKGYVCSEALVNKLKKSGIELIFKQRENMDPYLNKVYEDLLNQRQIIEGVFSYLKNRLKTLHPFARSCNSFLVHAKASVLAYMLKKQFC